MKLRNLLLTGMALFASSLFAQTHTQGIEYYKADQFYNAQELLKRNLNNAGTDKALSYYYLGQLALRENKTSEAMKYFNDGIALDAANPYNYIGLGFIDLKKGDEKGAEKYFKDAESRAKKDQTVQVEIARAYYNTDPVKYQAKYEKIIANALKKDSKNPDIYIFEGDVLSDKAYATQDSKIYGQAAAKYDMATSYDPQSAVAYVKYADMYMNANNPRFAITKLEELIKNNPNSALGQRQLADAYYENQQFDKAAVQYGNYVKNPNHFKEDEDRYAFILFYDNKFQDGFDYASSLLKQNPDNFSAMRYQFMNAAQIESMQGTLLPLAEKLLAAHRSNPDANKFASIDYTLIADELQKDGRPDDAIAVLQEGIQAIPTNANFHKQLANVYLDADKLDKTVEEFNLYLDKTPNPGYNDYLQLALYAYVTGVTGMGDQYYDIAVDNANKAAQASPSQYKPHKVLGDIAKARAQGDAAKSAAQPEYLIAVDLLGENPDPRFNNDAKNIYNYLGNYYLDQKNVSEAKKYFNKVLEIEPDNADFKKFVDSLN